MQDESLFQLDKNRLDELWVELPALYFDHAVDLADKRKNHELAKADRDIVAAELNRDIRSDPSTFGLDKVTDEVVKHTIILQDKHQKAQRKVIDTKHDVDIAECYIDGLEYNKKALENLVQLDGRNYFSRPTLSESLGGVLKDSMRKVERDGAFSSKKKAKK